jgi:hypothetical protein
MTVLYFFGNRIATVSDLSVKRYSQVTVCCAGPSGLRPQGSARLVLNIVNPYGLTVGSDAPSRNSGLDLSSVPWGDVVYKFTHAG